MAILRHADLPRDILYNKVYEVYYVRVRVYHVPVIPMPRRAVRQQNIGRFLKGILSHC